jgi:hypothetical protein
MTFREFNNTPINERAEYLWENGKFIEAIAGYYNQSVTLYCLHNYYVELYISSETNKIESIQAIQNDQLQKFLGRIKIDTF